MISSFIYHFFFMPRALSLLNWFVVFWKVRFSFSFRNALAMTCFRVMAEAGDKKKRTFRKFTYRGVDLEGLIDMPFDKVHHFLVLFNLFLVCISIMYFGVINVLLPNLKNYSRYVYSVEMNYALLCSFCISFRPSFPATSNVVCSQKKFPKLLPVFA